MTRAPAAVARALVSSVEPSSITRTSRQRAAARSSLTTPAIAADSLQAGMTTDTAAGSATSALLILARPLDAGLRIFFHRAHALELHRAHAVEQILEQLARAGDHVGHQ